MDIDEFLDRELSELGLQVNKAENAEAGIELPQQLGDFNDKELEEGLKEGTDTSPFFESIKSSLSKGNLEQAELSYTQIWHILVQQKLKWNKEIYEQLSVLSRQFASTLSYAYAEVRKKSDKVNELISRARDSLKAGKRELPFKLYSEIEEISNSIPNVFFEEKKLIEEQVMEFYKELRNVTDNELVKRAFALFNEISQLIEKINASIRANDIINAIVNYNRCIELYNHVPEGFLRHKNPVGMRLLDVYKSLSISNEISNLQRQLSQQPVQLQRLRQHPFKPPVERYTVMERYPIEASSKSMMLAAKKERAKRNIAKGFYNEALKDIQEALKLEPEDAEAKAINAKIKTLQ